MTLDQFSNKDIEKEYSHILYEELVNNLGEPSIIDDRNMFAYWYHPTSNGIKYNHVSLDYHGVHCSIQEKYNYKHAKLLLKTTRIAWFEPGKSLLTATGSSLDECNSIFKEIVLLFKNQIRPIEFNSYRKSPVEIPDVEIIATPGKPVNKTGRKSSTRVPPPLTMLSKK